MFHALENNHPWKEAHSIRTAEKPLAFRAKSMNLGFGRSIQYTVITAKCPSIPNVSRGVQEIQLAHLIQKIKTHAQSSRKW